MLCRGVVRLQTPLQRMHGATRRRDARVRRRVKTTALADLTLDSVLNPQSQPFIVIGGAGVSVAVLLAAGLVTQLTGGGKVTSVPPSNLKNLLNGKETLLVDIRNRAEVNELGSPSLSGFSARQRTLPFTRRTKNGDQIVGQFGEAFAKMKGLKEDSKVVLLDTSGKIGSMAAKEILKFNDLRTVYYVGGGATALKASGFQWKAPSEGVSLPKVPALPSLPKIPEIELKGLDLDKVAETYKQRPTLINTGLAVSAFAAAAVVLFNEFDVILEAVGLLGGINVLFRRFFFAEDREKTVNDLRSLFNEKIAAKEAGDDLKRLATTILEVPADPNERPTETVPPPIVTPAESTPKVPVREPQI